MHLPLGVEPAEVAVFPAPESNRLHLLVQTLRFFLATARVIMFIDSIYMNLTEGAAAPRGGHARA
jgi:hypothetical protein